MYACFSPLRKLIKDFPSKTLDRRFPGKPGKRSVETSNLLEEKFFPPLEALLCQWVADYLFKKVRFYSGTSFTTLSSGSLSESRPNGWNFKSSGHSCLSDTENEKLLFSNLNP